LSNHQEQKMQIVLVHVHVKPEYVDAFKQASIDNASNSVQEAGIARFDVIQQADDPTRFILVEVYKTTEAQAAHKETAHYARWRDTVAEMMAESRHGIKYTNIFPSNDNW
jgi:quinol monooxygenase YgiN